MLAYRALLTLAWPGFAILFAIRALRGQETWRDWAERLGFAGNGVPGGLWVHGASNGELASARPILAALTTRHPDLPLCITCNTLTARDMVDGWALPRTTARLAPLDTRWAALDARAHLTLESELWPNRIRRHPTIALGARLTARTARGWSRIPGLAPAVFPRLRGVIPQDAASATRFADLGVPAADIAAPVQLKSLYLPPDRDLPPDLAALPYARTWLAASTHAGEEDTVLDAHLARLSEDPDTVLILAPRHPARADEVAALIAARGLAAHRRSTGATPPGTRLLLADTMGEMDLFYRASHATFIGGTLTDRGGHTPFEPAAHGSAILHGPDTANFTDAFAALGPDAAIPVTDAASLAAGLARLSDPSAATEQAARASQALAATASADAVLTFLETRLGLET
ncbi:3-deoxy-D-manno-octulosonic acid transferase [Pseudaestuariivita atlantica]|uniref:3-deoxy-D-manno-octulosonic acid transferase n=1 Tax=Pseudaestuariivita atlantica TaxID=1317121 RepID=A0A0L1JSV1_9RHOB|nr:glycosyltransferase N-terminal domain-containing protein [Pseudaestuariivita atlantica]KNG94841.1 hypothetical protein ATO11_05505 [Pseudaestuariivita atlantica]